MTSRDTCGAILSIDLGAVVRNYKTLQQRLKGAQCSGVLKADAYGLGADRVGPALANAGCKIFFVALIDEGIRLRTSLPGAEIHILGGLLARTESVFVEHRLIPVLNSLGDIERWAGFARTAGRKMPADIHVDTGMLRLGLPPKELATLGGDMKRLEGLDIGNIISHLACADEPNHKKNAEQLDAFRKARKLLPMGKACFANSSGIFLGPDYHFDLARPGVALYGINPTPGVPNPMADSVRLQGKILQIRGVDYPETVGYGATHRFEGAGRIATVAVGYADGYLRSLSSRGLAYIGNHPAPLVGRVSMDLITLDVTEVPERLSRPGDLVDLIGPHNPPDAVAERAGTIGYEILTSLGARYHRTYIEPGTEGRAAR